MRFSAAPSHARSCASVAVAASTSDAAPVAWAARSRSRAATVAAAAVKRAASAGAVGFGDVAGPTSSSRDGSRPGRITGRVLNAGDDRDAAAERCPRAGCGDATDGSDVGGDEAVM